MTWTVNFNPHPLQINNKPWNYHQSSHSEKTAECKYIFTLFLLISTPDMLYTFLTQSVIYENFLTEKDEHYYGLVSI